MQLLTCTKSVSGDNDVYMLEGDGDGDNGGDDGCGGDNGDDD